MTGHIWRFPAHVERVVDGDTLDLEVDMGFNVRRRVRVRLDGIDTAEIYGVEKESDEYKEGIEHQKFVKEWVSNRGLTPWPFVIETEKETGKYGRYIATVEGPDGDVLNEDLVVEYPEVENVDQ